MKTIKIINPFCLVFGHNYFLTKNKKTNNTDVICKCCNKKFKYSLNGNIVDVSNKRGKQRDLYPTLSI